MAEMGGDIALDKLKRARAMSAAATLTELHALAAAWLAQIAYSRFEIEPVARNVGEALTLAHPNEHATLSRASLVVAQGLHAANRSDLAQPWYERAHTHAVAEADDVAISALMHNKTWLQMSSLRQAVLSDRIASTIGKVALLGATSMENFDSMIGTSSWDELKPILRAQILSLQGECSAALHLYEEHMPSVHLDGARRFQGNLLADRAWCHLQAGQPELAREAANRALTNLGPSMQVDDRAAGHSRLHQVFAALGETVLAEAQKQMAAEAWAAHACTQMKLVELLGSLPVPHA